MIDTYRANMTTTAGGAASHTTTINFQGWFTGFQLVLGTAVAADVTITDANSVNLYNKAGLNASAFHQVRVNAVDASGAAIANSFVPQPAIGPLTITIANGGNAATLSVILHVSKYIASYGLAIPARILQTPCVTKQDDILAGIYTRQISAADKVKALDSALMRYSQDFPRASVIDFAGDGGKYYVLSGQIINVDNADQDATIDLTSSGADQQLAIAFTLPRRMQVLAVRVLLKRTGSPAGTIAAQIRLPSGVLPAALSAATSNSLTSVSDLPVSHDQGKTEFTFGTPATLEAGTYYLALVAAGYTYNAGTTAIVLGV